MLSRLNLLGYVFVAYMVAVYVSLYTSKAYNMFACSNQKWFRCWLGTNQATSHYLNQWWLVYGCIYASLSLSEFIMPVTLARKYTEAIRSKHLHHCRRLGKQAMEWFNTHVMKTLLVTRITSLVAMKLPQMSLTYICNIYWLVLYILMASQQPGAHFDWDDDMDI